MKEDINIDELLNSFIDEELEPRQQTEVQRLLAHDEQIAQRLQELEKCRMLVASLPCAEAPAEMLEDIKSSLERRTLLGRQPENFEQQQGARHLLVRRVLAAAAMIGLVAVFAATVYTILAPESTTEQPIAVEQLQQPGEKMGVEKPIIRAKAVVKEFNSRIELKTSDLLAVDAFISKAIEDNGLLEDATPRIQGARRVHALSCSRESLNLLLADLGSIWSRFDSAMFFIESGQADGEIAVEAVGAEQIAEIINQDSFEKAVKLAKDFAVFNSMAELSPGKEILAVDDRGDIFVAIPKPVLTSNEKTIKETDSEVEDGQRVHMTIVVAGVE